MTSQVVIMNKTAAAVASDSSVTVSDGERPLRSYPTADKIFPLDGPHRLAILHNGCTDLLRVPYGVLLYEWSGSLASPLARVRDYAASFTSWLEAQTELFDGPNQAWYLEWMLRDYLLAVRSQLLAACSTHGLTPDTWSGGAGATLLREVLAARLDGLKDRTRYPKPGEDALRTFLAENADLIEGVTEWVFDDTPRSPEGDRLLRGIIDAVVAVPEPFSSDASLIFVGFGSDELFPASLPLDISGILAGQVRATSGDYQAVTTDDGVFISPYAQTEALNTFLRGYHPDVVQVAHDHLDEVLDTLDATTAQASREDLRAHHDELTDRVERLSWDEFVGPMLTTVAGLPAAELARTAEALVRLQVLRKLTRAEAETVGGPIDVGLISRRGGFTWCRHKSLVTELALEP